MLPVSFSFRLSRAGLLGAVVEFHRDVRDGDVLPHGAVLYARDQRDKEPELDREEGLPLALHPLKQLGFLRLQQHRRDEGAARVGRARVGGEMLSELLALEVSEAADGSRRVTLAEE